MAEEITQSNNPLLEVELKVKTEQTDIQQVLKSLGAKHVETVVQDDDYFKCGADQDRKLLFRVREKEGKFKLTLKGVAHEQNGIGWQEWEQSIDDPQALKNIFLTNDYVRVVRIKKERSTYSYLNCEVNVDSVEGLGTFLEVEALAQSVFEGRHIALGVLQELGFGESDIISQGYVPMMLERLSQKS